MATYLANANPTAATTALIGPEAAMACTAAVETEIFKQMTEVPAVEIIAHRVVWAMLQTAIKLGVNVALGTDQFPFEPNDGTVAVEETRLSGLADHAVIPTSHSGLLFSEEAARLALSFLGEGRFAPQARPTPDGGVAGSVTDSTRPPAGL